MYYHKMVPFPIGYLLGCVEILVQKLPVKFEQNLRIKKDLLYIYNILLFSYHSILNSVFYVAVIVNLLSHTQDFMTGERPFDVSNLKRIK